MRVFTCLTQDHNLWFVLLAAIMCVTGIHVTTRLFGRALADEGSSRLHWCFLTAMTAGAAIWGTHFIAMLGYNPGVPVTFDAAVTISSALIAVAGTGAGFMISTLRNRAIAALCGGGAIGLSISAMHYVGMFAYRVDGVVRWEPAYVIASILFSVALGALAIDRLRSMGASRLLPNALLVGAVVTLHFVGMAAFSVIPISGLTQELSDQVFVAMAGGIAVVAMLIICTGISIHLVEQRTRTASQNRLRHIALHDALTGLANRHHFSDAVKKGSQQIADNGVPFALLMVDLDRFKPVNDTFGHPVGDEVLRRVAQRLRHAVRAEDLVARIGGDEFAIIAYGVESAAAASEIAGRVVEILSRPFIIHGNIAELGASVGVALAPGHGADAATLTQHADIALYTAKREGRDRCVLFEPGLTDAILQRRALEADLRRACMRDDFEVYYQPVIDTVSGSYTGAEALVRWHCAGRGNVPPSDFIPLAEELGLVSRIGAHVLRRACADAAGWPSRLDVAVNLSPVQLLDPRLPQMVAQALEEACLPAERLELKITETALLGDADLALQSLQQLRELGVRISLDDFGTGYSSLSYLHRFPISRIKIDRSFVQRLPSDEGSATIVSAIAQLGERLGMMVTAEGIETDEQFAFIARQGCDHVQGFLISAPVPADQVAGLFAGRARNAA